MQAENLTIGYPGRTVAEGLSFDIAPGECILLAGANGCGKSTLLRTLAGTLPPLKGRIIPGTGATQKGGPALGKDLKAAAGALREGGLVAGTGASQEGGPALETDLKAAAGAGASREGGPKREVDWKFAAGAGALQYGGPDLAAAGLRGETVVLLPTGIPKVRGFSVEAFIRTACYAESGRSGALPPETEERMREALCLLGIEDLAQTDLSELSDGQFQLASIASALTRRAGLLLMDEPTAFLDVDNRRMLLGTLHALTRSEDLSVVFSSHDIHDALAVADRVFGWDPSGRFLTSDAGEPACRAALCRIFPSSTP